MGCVQIFPRVQGVTAALAVALQKTTCNAVTKLTWPSLLCLLCCVLEMPNIAVSAVMLQQVNWHQCADG